MHWVFFEIQENHEEKGRADNQYIHRRTPLKEWFKELISEGFFFGNLKKNPHRKQTIAGDDSL